MKMKSKYHNYEAHPVQKIEGFPGQAWAGCPDIIKEWNQKIKELGLKKTILCLDYYPGVNKKELLEVAEAMAPSLLIDMETLAKPEEELTKQFQDYLTEDRVFGVMCHKNLDCFYQSGALLEAQKQIKEWEQGLVLVLGMGTSLLCSGNIHVWCSITRWEIQLRYRAGMPNYLCSNYEAPALAKNKRGFFIEWRLADRYKKQHYEEFDYLLEMEQSHNPHMITGEAYRGGLRSLANRPFRMEPYFDPGVWGGHWMQDQFELPKEDENLAWSFDGVPEENSINLAYGDVTVKIPAIDLVFYQPHELLGERVHARFGAEFPIRFDLLDTMGGGNLSLQVHPLTEYIQDTFGMHYTQDESYYLLDAEETEETYVYLGVKEGVDQTAMAADLRRAETGEIAFPAEKYVNQIPVKKHDHVLIPAGTIHCSGSNTMVLEVSATPYIFTFKLWDWGRAGLDGIPRPIHVEHGLQNIQWERDTKWVEENLIHQEVILEEEDGNLVERTGLHDREFIDTIRYSLTKEICIQMNDTVHVMNLVDGKNAYIESIDGSFEAFEIHYAETAIVPAKVGEYRVVPGEQPIKLLVASIK